MADRNSYLRYKRDQRKLTYWLIQTSNRIIKSKLDATTLTVNKTGHLSLSKIKELSILISKHGKPVPSIIYRLFQSVIQARKAANSLFVQIASREPDQEIERSNISHRVYIDALSQAFENLGGNVWAAEEEWGKQSSDEEEGIDDVAFLNRFSSLGADAENDGDGSGEESDTPTTQARSKQRLPNKSKKGGRGKRAKGHYSRSLVKDEIPKEVPFESYRIIEDEEGLITDYLMAVYSLTQEWSELRHFIQGLWYDVSYGNLNSAVAATMSNIAIAMLKQTETDIFLEFPGHATYETVMQTITRGNIEKAEGMFGIALLRIDHDNVASPPQTVEEARIDIKEEFMIHVYQDLYDFLIDFRKNRSGKPTKRLLSEISNWDPNLDLIRATKEERIQWRRVYTINWLYDLVNLFSSIVIQRITQKGQKIVLETVDWSVNGPWNVHRRLFGLNEFAGEITSLAFQAATTDIRQKILPHHVFQMACIVDSLTVSRGWSTNILRGHVLCPPAPGFRPRRDVDLFLDREGINFGRGYCESIDVLIQLLERDDMLHEHSYRHLGKYGVLKTLQEDFVNWLGESKYMHGLTSIPPSRFSNTNTNGLWEYSPFLCGAGLAEGLELAYGTSMLILDRLPEPICLVHLHNMLVQKGYIKKKIGLYTALSEQFPTAFFSGKPPTSNFLEAFWKHCSTPYHKRFERRGIRQNSNQTEVDVHKLLKLNTNRFFTDNSMLTLYRESGYLPERIPDEQLDPISLLGSLRLSQTRISVDPKTGKGVVDETPLVLHARARGMTDDEILKISEVVKYIKDHDSEIPESVMPQLPEGYRNMTNNIAKKKEKASFRDMLPYLKMDIVNDIQGEIRPRSSLNYIWVMAQSMMLFMAMEDELSEFRNPSYIQAYKEDIAMMFDKRVSLTALALAGHDDGLLRVMASKFEDMRTGFTTHIYWDDLDSAKKVSEDTKSEFLPGIEGSCVVM